MMPAPPTERREPARRASIHFEISTWIRRNRSASSGVYRPMKRDSSRLLVATLRTGSMVAIALLLILVLLPAALAAQGAGLR